MRRPKFYLLIGLLFASISICSAQKEAADSCSSQDVPIQGQRSIGHFASGVCKLDGFVFKTFDTTQNLFRESHPLAGIFPTDRRTKLLQVSGNILYDVNYRSGIDTPYADKNIYQHTLQTRLDFVYKERYPFKIYLTTHFSNSSLFRKYIDLNFQYRQADFARLLKQRIINIAESALLSHTKKLDSLRRLIEWDKANIASLSHSLQKPDINQRLVEKREQNLFGNGNVQPTANISGYHPDIQNRIIKEGESRFTSVFQSNSKDSTAENKAKGDLHKIDAYKDSLDQKKKKLDSLVAELNKTEKLYINLLSVEQVDQSKLRNEINSATDVSSLTRELQQLHISDSVLPKGYKTLYSVKSFNLGRSIIDYSELSVKDISITGVQAEYNPHYYYAFAVGKIDYRFRDYLVPADSRTHQYLALVRFGKGTRNGNHTILTYYTGRRQYFNSGVALSSGNAIPEYNLAGITIEEYYKLNKNISVIAEVAKSTEPYYSLDSLQKKNWANSVIRFKDRSNEAYSLTLNSFFPSTQTRFSGNAKYTGANFQSFSTFTTGASQLRWSARLEQPLFKRRLTIFSAVQQNEYNNPFVATSYKTSSILASFQATLRIKKWPFLSMGYFPSYQLTKIGNDNFTENRYYTLEANAGYYYQLHSVQLASYVVFTRFYNSGSDSGFVYFNSRNILISQTAAIKNFSFQLDGSLSANIGYDIYTVENKDQVNLGRRLSIGAGVKLIKQTLIERLLWGYSGNIRFGIAKLGDIQLMFDKGYLPGLQRNLVTNNMGRLTYFKTF